MATKEKTKESVKFILKGLFYLSREAEASELPSIRNLLLTVMDDITGWADNHPEGLEISSTKIITNSSFLAAIEFISKFAAIKDEQLKKEIIEELRKVDENASGNIRIFPFKHH